MRLPLIHHVFCFLCMCFAMTATLAIQLSKPGCPEKCGNVTIPYPFGIGSKCSANSSFTVICHNSTHRPILSSINLEVVNISTFGTIIVNQPVSPMNCSVGPTTQSLLISLKGSLFTISARYNSLAVLGCKNSVWLRANKTTTTGGCLAICDANSTDTSCNGVNCCQITMPTRLQQLQYTYQSIQASNSSFCGYVFPVDKKWLSKDYKGYRNLLRDLSNPFDREFGFAPLVLEWEFDLAFVDTYSTTCSCRDHDDYMNSDHFGTYPYDYNYHCQSSYRYRYNRYRYSSSYYYAAADYVSSTMYCLCYSGFEGNPYLPGGCKDINECAPVNGTSSHQCRPPGICVNMKGGYDCHYPYDDNQSRARVIRNIKIAFISIGSVLGGLVLLIGGWKSTKALRKIIKASRRYMFFKRNGGLLLEQQLSATANGIEKTRLFTSKELAHATDRYNENRILGRGGQGTVYKGMLADGRIVAVKKSQRVEEGDIEVFINEVVILSQINHRNVVKLLGCCLETEVPRLVYEFIPNGTLFQHIHEPNEEFPLTWEMRVRIAREIAGALAYLHSSASTPIYHRDIKSINILLDDKYRAKVADFGTSRSVAIDQTHVTTRVLGTFGYMDPEYFRSSQFTEKSDVYSFGVVVVELLTGEKAVTSIRAESGKSLALHFLHSMDEDQLFDILDPMVLKEGNREEIMAIAELARRCLHLNGKTRPTMKEVAVELEGIQMLKEASVLLQNQEDNRECNSIEGAESDDFSSISGSMHFDTISSYSPDADCLLLDEP